MLVILEKSVMVVKTNVGDETSLLEKNGTKVRFVVVRGKRKRSQRRESE